MMARELTDHIVEGDSVNHQVRVLVADQPGQGGACHRYEIHLPKTYDLEIVDINFQNGPIKEFGVNGVTHEALLSILLDRLRGFQGGPYASEYNQRALEAGEKMLYELQTRTRERIARNVEGTNVI